MKVTTWISYSDTEKENCKYQDLPNELFKEAFDAVVKDAKERGYQFSGQEHQNTDWCVPVLDNKYYLTCSCRVWGDIMARAHDDYDELGYVVWAWNSTSDIKKFIYPNPDDYKEDK